MAANPAGLVSENKNRAQPCRMDLKSLWMCWWTPALAVGWPERFFSRSSAFPSTLSARGRAGLWPPAWQP